VTPIWFVAIASGVQLDVLWRAAVMAVSHDADSAGPV